MNYRLRRWGDLFYYTYRLAKDSDYDTITYLAIVP